MPQKNSGPPIKIPFLYNYFLPQKIHFCINIFWTYYNESMRENLRVNRCIVKRYQTQNSTANTSFDHSIHYFNYEDKLVRIS